MSRTLMNYEEDHIAETDDDITVSLLPHDRNKCACIADMIVLQCILVCVGAASILACLWTPEHSSTDYGKLMRIMYLYDSKACGYQVKKDREIANLQLSNETFGLDILPIKWLPVITSVSTRLSAKTRQYIQFSFAFHVIWFILAVFFRAIIKNSEDVRVLKIALIVFFYSCVFMICYDLSMAVVYVTHIKQSLTKGMILRYSGWSTELKLETYEDFAGWLPMIASACWLRGIVIFMLNMYFCRLLTFYRRKMVKNVLFHRKLFTIQYQPFPEAGRVQRQDPKMLVYKVTDD
ncbi:hypothetical protein PYW07_003474 [Mythimna separata]|uniref:Uncharacterized protein n=1 Tax=Mythimna separata TaxID=271217 RepID=A0AAD8DRW0_MYTSE|nr:hypothetical protein PYW07_003474 [Mythimna separata]